MISRIGDTEDLWLADLAALDTPQNRQEAMEGTVEDWGRPRACWPLHKRTRCPRPANGSITRPRLCRGLEIFGPFGRSRDVILNEHRLPSLIGQSVLRRVAELVI